MKFAKASRPSQDRIVVLICFLFSSSLADTMVMYYVAFTPLFGESVPDDAVRDNSQDHEVKSMLTSTMCKSDPESDVAGVLDEENMCSCPRHSTLLTTVTSGDATECTPGIDIQLSPKKALRAAMLKSRFADTILKAKQKILLKHDHKVDPVKLQQEKERLERQQQEDLWQLSVYPVLRVHLPLVGRQSA